MVALKELLTFSGSALGPRTDESIRRMQSVLQRSLKQDSAAVLAAVGSPDVMVPLLSMAAGLRAPLDVAPDMMVALFASLAAESVPLEEALVWEEPVGTLPVPREGTLEFEPPAKALLVDPAGLAVELADGQRIDINEFDGIDAAGVRVGHRFVAIGPRHLDVHLSLHDSNPLALEEAHPDKDGNTVTLGDKSLDAWLAALNEALELIRLGLPEWYEELRDTTVRVLPVGYEPEMHLSASYREAPGVVYLTLHPDPLTMAEALVHETQHGKLNLLTWLDPVLHNAYTSWSASPVRPDLRPIMGVFLAVHAFVPVAALHARLAAANHALAQTRRFAERRAEVMAGNAGGLAVVRNTAEPTAMGARVLGGLQSVHEVLMGLVDASDWSDDALPMG
ncbi:MAG: HEXXH motif-containing putative peptide modification protein [Myxococcota bacterium]|nr:HEXXH motif-containing putative peptide modification protein [Myxococcota bacterium]MEC9391788.1 HEXXH motif-containing putative peptide modification protein [Myxococcota bacterium]